MNMNKEGPKEKATTAQSKLMNTQSSGSGEELKQSVTAPATCQIPRSFSTTQNRRQSSQVEQKMIFDEGRVIDAVKGPDIKVTEIDKDANHYNIQEGGGATRNSLLTELGKCDEMKPQFISPINHVNGSQSLVEYQKQLNEERTPCKNVELGENSQSSAVKMRAMSSGNFTVKSIVMSPPPKSGGSKKNSCRKKRASHLSNQPMMQQIFSPQAKKLFKKSHIKSASKSITDGVTASLSVNQSQIISVHPQQPNDIAELVDEDLGEENLYDDSPKPVKFNPEDGDSFERPNKLIGESKSSHANKAIRAKRKKPTMYLEQMQESVDAGFPREHFEDDVDANTMTTREMLERENQNKNQIFDRLKDKPEEQQNRRNAVSSIKPKMMGSEYFENVGQGMPYGDLDEHGGQQQQQIDYEKLNQMRRTIDPSQSNNSLGKSGASLNKKSVGITTSSRTPALYANKRRTTPFLPESQKTEPKIINPQSNIYSSMQELDSNGIRSKSVLKHKNHDQVRLTSELLHSYEEQPKVKTTQSASKTYHTSRHRGFVSHSSLNNMYSNFEQKSTSLSMMHNNPLNKNNESTLILDENYGQIGIKKISNMGRNTYEGKDYLVVGQKRATNRSAMVIGSTIQNNSEIHKTTVQAPRRMEELMLLQDGEKTMKLDLKQNIKLNDKLMHGASSAKAHSSKDPNLSKVGTTTHLLGSGGSKGRNQMLAGGSTDQHHRTNSNMLKGNFFNQITTSFFKLWDDKNASKQQAKYASNGYNTAGLGDDDNQDENCILETMEIHEGFDTKLHPTKMIERDWHNSEKLAQLIQKQERMVKLSDDDDRINLTIAQFGGISKERMEAAFLLPKIRSTTTAGHRSPARGQLPPSTRSRLTGDLTSTGVRGKMTTSHRNIALSGRGSRFGPSEYGGTHNSQTLIDTQGLDSSHLRSERAADQSSPGNSDNLSGSDRSDHWVATSKKIVQRQDPRFDQPNILIEKFQKKQMERTMSSMRETVSDLHTLNRHDQGSQKDSVGTKRGLILQHDQLNQQIQRVKMGSQTPMIRPRAMETAGSEPMHATQESVNVQNILHGSNAVNRIQAIENREPTHTDDEMTLDQNQKLNPHTIALSHQKSKDLLLQDLQTVTLDEYANNMHAQPKEREVNHQISQNELMNNSMANQSKFCDSEDFVMSNTSISQNNQSHVLDNPMGNFNLDEPGHANSLKSSQVSDSRGLKQQVNSTYNAAGVYGAAQKSHQYRHHPGSNNSHFNIQVRSKINVASLNELNQNEFLHNDFEMTDEGEHSTGSQESQDEPIQHAITDGQVISITKESHKHSSRLLEQQAKTNIQAKQRQLVDKTSHTRKRSNLDAKVMKSNTVVAQFTGSQIPISSLQQPQIINTGNKIKSASTTNLKLTRMPKKQISNPLDGQPASSVNLSKQSQGQTSQIMASISAKTEHNRRISQDGTSSSRQLYGANIFRMKQKQTRNGQPAGTARDVSNNQSQQNQSHNFKSKQHGIRGVGKSQSITGDIGRNKHAFSAQAKSVEKGIVSSAAISTVRKVTNNGSSVKPSHQPLSSRVRQATKLQIPSNLNNKQFGQNLATSSRTTANKSLGIGNNQSLMMSTPTQQESSKYKFGKVQSAKRGSHQINQSLDTGLYASNSTALLQADGQPNKFQHNFKLRKNSKPHTSVSNSQSMAIDGGIKVQTVRQKKHSYASPEVIHPAQNYFSNANQSQFNQQMLIGSLGNPMLSHSNSMAQQLMDHDASTLIMQDSCSPQQAQIEASKQMIKNQARQRNLKKSPLMGSANQMTAMMSHQISAAHLQNNADK